MARVNACKGILSGETVSPLKRDTYKNFEDLRDKAFGGPGGPVQFTIPQRVWEEKWPDVPYQGVAQRAILVGCEKDGKWGLAISFEDTEPNRHDLYFFIQKLTLISATGRCIGLLKRWA